MHNACMIPGSFDPPTIGHLRLFERASALYDSVLVAVLVNSAKKPLFSLEERVAMISDITRELGNVEAAGFTGLTVDFARQKGIGVILRGLRSAGDWEYEQPLAALNRQMAPGIETIFLPTEGEYSHISARMVREIGALGGDISHMVPEPIYNTIEKALIKRRT